MDPSVPETLVGLEQDTYIGIICRLYDQNRQLSELLQSYIQEQYGPKTERFEDPNQLRLFSDESAGDADSTNSEEPPAQEPKTKKGSSRERKPRSSQLRRERIVAKSLTAADWLCGCCGKTRVKVVYIGDKDHPYILFQYTKGRARAGPKEFLRGFNRYLQGDCFSGNEAICAENGAILVACNAHARRYFKKALQNYKKKSEEALRVYQNLFGIERDAKELGITGEDLRVMREQEAKPILAEFKLWLDQEQLTALPKSAFGKAVNYCLNNWEALTAYQLSGDLSIDNNQAEQEMKRIATGRKAWLFFGSDNGGERAEVLMMSIIATCKLHGVDPWAYLKDVIEILTINPCADLRSLLPTSWKPKKKAEAERQTIECARLCAQTVSKRS